MCKYKIWSGIFPLKILRDRGEATDWKLIEELERLDQKQ